MGTTQITAPSDLPFIDFEREFDAPPDLLFRAHSEPDLIVQWLGPKQYRMEIDEYDCRDGGRWRYVHRDDEGNAWGFHGVFHGAQSPAGMVQTFEFEGAPGHVSLDSVRFEAIDGGRSRLVGRSVFQSVEARDAMVEGGMETGVNEGYARLDDLVARLQPVH
jgi:uncharacterized protein YndB with AHSA1/START domain